MADFKYQTIFLILSVIFLIHASDLSSTEAALGFSFSVDLISRDSPLSPFYNSSQTRSERLQNAFRRSISRSNHFRLTRSFPEAIQSEVIQNFGSYLMNVSFGTPPVPILAIADTGSDLTWIQCSPCIDCYQQVSPLFDPINSATYDDLSCETQACQALDIKTCSSDGKCEYSYSYADRSFTRGYLASETLTFTSGGSFSFQNHVFGCGHNNGGTFRKEGSGLVGLGGGSLSLVSQLSSSINGQFSYCLVPTFSGESSKMNFGNIGDVSGFGVVSTPLIKSRPETFYYLTLEGMSVGSKKLVYNGFTEFPATEGQGNIIIDSGTTFTILPQEFYSDLESLVIEAMGGDQVSDPTGSLELCYAYRDDMSFPIITVHFTGADLELQPINTFTRVVNDVVCLSIVPSSDGHPIFGNLAQINFLVGFDLNNEVVSFEPTDCTNH